MCITQHHQQNLHNLHKHAERKASVEIWSCGCDAAGLFLVQGLQGLGKAADLYVSTHLVKSELHAFIIPRLLDLLRNWNFQLLLSRQPDPVSWQNILENCQQGQHSQT